MAEFLSPAGEVCEFSVGALAATFDLGPATRSLARIDNSPTKSTKQPAAFARPSRSVMAGVRAKF